MKSTVRLNQFGLKESLEPVARQVGGAFGVPVTLDSNLTLGVRFLRAIDQGTKPHTIKIHQANNLPAIRFPAQRQLPVYESGDSRPIGTIVFDLVQIKPYGALTDSECIDDGFSGSDEFRHGAEDLARSRGFLVPLPTDWPVSLYHIERVAWRDGYERRLRR